MAITPSRHHKSRCRHAYSKIQSQTDHIRGPVKKKQSRMPRDQDPFLDQSQDEMESDLSSTDAFPEIGDLQLNGEPDSEFCYQSD